MLKRTSARTGRATRRGPTSPVLPWLPALAVAVGSGLLIDLAFPSTDLWYLAAPGVAGLVVATTGRRPGAGALLGFATGLAQCLPQLSWAGVYVGPVAWVPLSAAVAVSLALAGVLLTGIARCPGGPLVRAAAVGGAWVAVEAVISRFPFGGFGWTRLAFSQADAPALGLAALGGAPLVSFAVAATGGLLAAALLAAVGGDGARARGGRVRGGRVRGARARGGRARGGRLVGSASLVLVALAVQALGALVPRPTAAQAGTLDVAAVQGNVPRAGLDFDAQRRAVLDDHVRETARLVAQVAAGRRPAPQLVVWPENSSDVDPLRNPDAFDEIAATTASLHAPLLLGAVLQRDDGRLRNTSMLWEPGRGPVASYDKRHPVPFGEYIPDRAFFRHFTSAVDDVREDFVPGHRVGRIDAAGARLGVMICFEVVEDGLVDDTVDHGADLLVVQTNNATFGYTDESVQQLAMSRLRAVEHARAVVHISTVGRSALITPDGAVHQETSLFTPALLQARLPLRTSLTVADRLRADHVPVEALLAAFGVLGALGGAARAASGRVRPTGRGRRGAAGGAR